MQLCFGRGGRRSSRGSGRLAVVAAVAMLLAGATGATCAELRIFGSRVTKMLVGDIAAAFERDTGHTLVVITDVAAVMKRRIEADEPVDLAVLVDFQTDDLIRQGKLVADTRADIMRSGIGLAVRKGAPRPDISTVDAFKQTLLAARSITYLKEGASTLHLDRVFAKLGVTEAVKAKAMQPMTESVSEMVASGDAEIGIIVIPNILSVPGAELVGPIPAEVNSYIMFTGAVGARSREQQAARALLGILTSPATRPLIAAKGMEPG